MNEFDFVRRLREQVKSHAQSSQVLCGIGDDAAILKAEPGRDLVISVDLLVEDVDFHRDGIAPRFLGHKALAVSLSDIAAMGSKPRWAMLSVGIPDDVWTTDFLNHLYDGMFGLADRYQIALIGGDTSRTPEKIVIDSIVLGDCGEGKAVLRSGAKPGDLIFVTGSLGSAAAGLRLLNRGARFRGVEQNDPEVAALGSVMLRHSVPEPRVGWGVVLGEDQLASAMIDISDGLSSDLHHLCASSQVGALVDASRIPIDPAIVELCGHRALDPLQLALHGGEDFELVFTVPQANLSKLPKKVDGICITYIGTVESAANGVRIAEGSRIWNLEPGGWQHFEKAQAGA